MVADLGGLADDDAGGVVDEEGAADAGAGMDVGAGLGVDPLAHDAGDDGHAELVELVGEAVRGDGQQSGIGQQDFREGQRGGIAVVGRLHVGHEQLAHAGQRVEERLQDAVGFAVEVVDLGRAGAFDARGLADPAVGQGTADFPAQQAPGFAQPADQEHAQFRAVHRRGADLAGKHRVQQHAQRVHHVLRRRTVRQQPVGRIRGFAVEQPRQRIGRLADFRFRRVGRAQMLRLGHVLFHEWRLMPGACRATRHVLGQPSDGSQRILRTAVVPVALVGELVGATLVVAGETEA